MLILEEFSLFHESLDLEGEKFVTFIGNHQCFKDDLRSIVFL